MRLYPLILTVRPDTAFVELPVWIPGNPNPLQTIDDEFVSVDAQLQEDCLMENSGVLKIINCKERLKVNLECGI